MQVVLKNVRLAFPALFEPRSLEGGAARYSAVFIIDPDSENAKAVDAAMKEAAKAKWGDKAPVVYKRLLTDKRVCLRTEPRTNKDGEVYDGFEDKYSLSASNKVRPTVVDRDRSPLTEADGKPYGGCYVNAIVDIYAQDHKDPTIGRRINASLMGVQFVKDGESFGAPRVAKEDAFDMLAEDENAPF